MRFTVINASASKTKGKAKIAYFTVTVEAGVDLVLIQPLLLYYVDLHVVVMETVSVFNKICIYTKRKEV